MGRGRPEESRWVDGGAERWPTAFVAADAEGRELDVHVIDIGPDGRCVSRETQLAMHTGYSLPDGHLRDLELLRAD